MSDYSYSDDDSSMASLSEESGSDDDELIEIENAFCEAEEIRDSEPSKAIELFESVVTRSEARTESDTDDKMFLSLKFLVELHFRVNQYDELVKRYRQMLGCTDKVTSNTLNEGINHVLDVVSEGKNARLDEVYDITLKALKSSSFGRLWFSVKARRAELYLALHDYDRVRTIIEELHDQCRTPDGQDDRNKANDLMKMYALDIQVANATGDTARVEAIYPQVVKLSSAILDQAIKGVIWFSFGQMHLNAGKYAEAYKELFDAFLAYQEIGNEKAITCLMYLATANMLDNRKINPFESPEAKVYNENPQIKAMMKIRDAYGSDNIKLFEDTLRDPACTVTKDPVLRMHVEELRLVVQNRVLLATLRPYKAVRLSFIAEELGMDPTTVESRVVQLILDGKLDALVDQVDGTVRLGTSSHADSVATELGPWVDALQDMRVAIGQAAATYAMH